MTDITMCVHNGCKQEQSCYRKRAIASEYQSMADLYDPHSTVPTIPCLNFWDIKGRRDIEPLEPAS